MLKREMVCRLAFAVQGEPYIVPLSYGFDEEQNALFFHTARQGRKNTFISENPRVCFEVEGRVALRTGGTQACSWSLDYESIVGYGTLSEVHGEEAKHRALCCLMRQQTGRDQAWTFAPEMVRATLVWRLDIDVMSGKCSSPR